MASVALKLEVEAWDRDFMRQIRLTLPNNEYVVAS
jgi:hypothetical protein